MKYKVDRAYVGKDFDKMDETQYKAFSEFIEEMMSKYFTEQELILIRQSDIISRHYLAGGQINQVQIDLVVQVEALVKGRLPETFLQSITNYYGNKYFRENVHIN